MFLMVAVMAGTCHNSFNHPLMLDEGHFQFFTPKNNAAIIIFGHKMLS